MPEVIVALAPKRQTLYRVVWAGGGEAPGGNKYYDEVNTCPNP